jgi:Transcriptional regulator containing an amidase domain and an AraC-type DNA-binding HTH domain
LKTHTLKFHDYLPVGEQELDWGLYVTVAGYNRVLPKESFPSRNHPASYQFDPTVGRYLHEYQLIYISNGRGTFSSEKTGTIDLLSGTAFLLFPDVWHTYSPNRETGWEDYWIGFNGSYIYELCRRNVLSPDNPIFYPSKQQEIVQVFENLLKAMRLEPMNNSMHYSAKALEIIALTLEKSAKIREEYDGKEKIVEDAMQMIWGWSYRVLSVTDITRQLGIQRRTLERYFREIRGATVLEEIMNCRLSRARRLLEQTRIPIGQVARMAGFSTVQQMRRNFHLFYDKSPETFRRSQKNMS